MSILLFFPLSFSPSCWSWHLFSHWSTVLSIDQTNQYEQHPGDDERRRYRRRRRKAVWSPHRTANENEKERVEVISEYLQRRGEREIGVSSLSLLYGVLKAEPKTDTFLEERKERERERESEKKYRLLLECAEALFNRIRDKIEWSFWLIHFSRRYRTCLPRPVTRLWYVSLALLDRLGQQVLNILVARL